MSIKNLSKFRRTSYRLFFLGLIGFSLVGCHQESGLEKKVSSIPMNFKVERFDQAFARTDSAQLPQLKAKYPFLFPKQFPDSVWVNLLRDSIQQEINTEVAKAFPNFESEKEELRELFQHLAYYFPGFKPPRVVTITSSVDYSKRIVLTDSLLLISLDVYLGKDHPFYEGIQRYFSKNFVPTQIVPNIDQEYAKKYIPKPGRSFIDYMVYYGKMEYFKKQMLPQVADSTLMGYTDKEWKWANANERHIWGYMIEHKLLYQTNPDLRRRFFKIGPFTSFGLQLDSESPAQLGRFIGWQIVNQYLNKHKNTKLKELLRMDNKALFEASNYKPKQE